MSKKKRYTGQITLRLSGEEDELLTAVANQKKTTRVQVVRKAIELLANDTNLQNIADRLDEINRQFSTVATLSDVEKISTQLADMAEANNANVKGLVQAIGIIGARLP